MINNQYSIIDIITSLTAGNIVKWFLVVGLVMYAIFAAIVIRQVGVMSESIEDDFNWAVRLFAWLHFGLAILLLITSITLL